MQMVEQTIHAAAGTVRRALTEPAEIARWFGWDADGLDAEIRLIFVEHARWDGPDRLETQDGTIELDDLGADTVLRVLRATGPGFDPVEEGWRAFLVQLSFGLERHPGAARRTVRLTGDKPAADVLAALPGETVLDGEFVRAVDAGGALAVVEARAGVGASGPAPVAVTVTFYGDNGDSDAWAAWWEEIG
jgi:hypothetical protein